MKYIISYLHPTKIRCNQPSFFECVFLLGYFAAQSPWVFLLLLLNARQCDSLFISESILLHHCNHLVFCQQRRVFVILLFHVPRCIDDKCRAAAKTSFNFPCSCQYDSTLPTKQPQQLLTLCTTL